MPRQNSTIRQYALVTGNYWAFTLTDGALRMLVVLHFHQLGYSPLQVAMLFLFYEIFGVVTNLFGGYLGARIGLNRTMNIGLFMQVVALLCLAVPTGFLSIPLVMGAQALSGIAKDLNKMSAKSFIKSMVAESQQGQLFKWVALLTGSKNALKGVGFFLGGALLTLFGFKVSMLLMASVLAIFWIASLFLLKQDLGKAKTKPKFSELFSKSRAINILSAARLFLFGARDIWFVVALPVFLSTQLGWSFWSVGGFLAAWVIAYGIVQSFAPSIVRKTKSNRSEVPVSHLVVWWAVLLAVVTGLVAAAVQSNLYTEIFLIVGLIVFGAVFAINSSLHSYLIVRYAKADGASLDVGFYYMANALGRLIGTLLSGWIYQSAGLTSCLWASAFFITLTALISMGLPREQTVII
ncbi:MAG: organoarsenical effux MFS transporter ArsJ [Gammaproteobacteria bacterium]|nr:MAG: organoarsenical effux MFS transporter ArsJ [Gammaproteobacteria bacterium]